MSKVNNSNELTPELLHERLNTQEHKLKSLELMATCLLDMLIKSKKKQPYIIDQQKDTKETDANEDFVQEIIDVSHQFVNIIIKIVDALSKVRSDVDKIINKKKKPK